jgi:hypothetical protein
LIVPLLKFAKPFTLVGADTSLTLCREIAAGGVPRHMSRVEAKGALEKLLLKQ